VVVATVPGVSVSANGSLELDGDSINDLSFASAGCEPIPNLMTALPGTLTAQLSKDYRLITVADLGSAVFLSGDFCVGSASLEEYRDYLSGFLVRTSSGATYRMWIADSTAQGVRLQYALLASSQIFSSGFE
jgi:hypothetical protein